MWAGGVVSEFQELIDHGSSIALFRAHTLCRAAPRRSLSMGDFAHELPTTGLYTERVLAPELRKAVAPPLRSAVL